MFCFTALHVPVLVRHPETIELIINYDPLIGSVIREAEGMRKLDLEVPHIANVLSFSQQQLKNDKAQLQVISYFVIS